MAGSPDRQAAGAAVRPSGVGVRTALKGRIESHEELHHLFLLTYGAAAEYVRAVPDRRRTERLLAAGQPLTADIGVPMGLGGILAWIGRVLELAERLDRPIGIMCSSDTYRPSWPVADWLDCYFERHLDEPGGQPVDVASLPLRPYQPIAAVAQRVWRYLSVRPEYVAAAKAIPFSSFASVHYRGSDKHLEAPRTNPETVLRRVEQEMCSAKLSKLFVASDETSFVQLAKDRFGEDCWSLPLVAVAENGRPPHLTSVAGEIKAGEALTTMALLAQSELCVRTESSLSEWAMTMPGKRRAVLVEGARRRLLHRLAR